MSKKKNVIAIIILTITLVSLIIGFTFLLVKGRAETTHKDKPTIAFVNEDVSSEFNHNTYNFGENFVNLVLNNDAYNWQIVSRSVADRAYIDGSVDAVIYLPQTFSKDLLTLQSINPTQANVSYKIQNQTDDLSARIIQDKILSALQTFNQNVVKMYYSSVANNIADAEGQMNQSVGNQNNLVNNLTAQIQNPFKKSMPNYDTFITSTTGLNALNKANVSLQNNFTDSTNKLMTQTSNNFINQLPSIKNYFDTQRQIAEINVKNSNKGILNQSDADQVFYSDQFKGLYTDILSKLADFYQKDSNGSENGQFIELKRKVTDYNTLIGESRKNISDQVTVLTNKRDDLLKLEGNLYKQFLNNDISITTENFDDFTNLQTTENAKSALVKKLSTSFVKQDYLTGTDYLNHLKTMISSLSLNISDYKLDNLVTNGTVTADTKEKYEKELQVIRQYADAFDLQGYEHLIIEDAPTKDMVNQSLRRHIKITVPAGEIYKSSKISKDVTIKKDDDAGINVDKNNSIILDNSTDKPVTFEFEFEINMSNKSSYNFDLSWTNKKTKEQLSHTVDMLSLDPKEETTSYNKYVEKNFKNWIELLSKIDSTSNIISTLYADPSEDYTSLLPATTKDDFKNKSQKSIFNMYGNIEPSTLPTRISDQDVQDFMNMGQSNLTTVIHTIKDLNNTINNLKENESHLQKNMPEDYFANNLAALFDWLQTTSQKIEDTYRSWRNLPPTTLEVKNWQNYDSSKTELYEDTSNSLHEQIKKIISDNQNATKTISENSQIVKDNSAQFEQLISRASTTQGDARNLLSYIDNLVLTGNKGALDSNNFYKNFSKTLLNTRTPGANTDEIYNFFANPIANNNVTPEKDDNSNSQNSFDYKWILIFGIGMITGLLMLLLGQMLIKKVHHKNN